MMMACRVARGMRGVSFLACVGLLTVGCAMQDPPALTELYKARDGLQAAKTAGANERFPDDYVALEKQYQLARGTFYACNDSKAMAMAQTLVADARALATKPVMVAAPAPPPPSANQRPIAKLLGPAQANMNSVLTFQAEESTDPDGDKLTYRWNFGDGTSNDSSIGVGTHRYTQPGNYTVSLTVDDGRGGIDTATGTVSVVSLQVLRGSVLFDANQATLKADSMKELDTVVNTLKQDPSLHAELVGYADAQGPPKHNLELSKKRTEAVANYLTSRGIPADRLDLSWKGEAEPVAPNTTKAGRAQNRRTAIILRPASR